MTDFGSSPPRLETEHVAYGSEPEPSGWTGWVVFAGFMMIMVGSFQIVQGLVALFEKGYYAVAKNGLAIHVDYTTWGWLHLLLGVVLLMTGVGVLYGNIAARFLGVVFAGLSALANLLFFAAYPFWSLTIITVDILVIYALTVHGREMRAASR